MIYKENKEQDYTTEHDLWKLHRNSNIPKGVCIPHFLSQFMSDLLVF